MIALFCLKKKEKIEKVQKPAANLHDKKNMLFVIHIRNLKEALNDGLVLKKAHIIN